MKTLLWTVFFLAMSSGVVSAQSITIDFGGVVETISFSTGDVSIITAKLAAENARRATRLEPPLTLEEFIRATVERYLDARYRLGDTVLACGEKWEAMTKGVQDEVVGLFDGVNPCKSR